MSGEIGRQEAGNLGGVHDPAVEQTTQQEQRLTRRGVQLVERDFITGGKLPACARRISRLRYK